MIRVEEFSGVGDQFAISRMVDGELIDAGRRVEAAASQSNVRKRGGRLTNHSVALTDFRH
jgi:hypothetical protein